MMQSMPSTDSTARTHTSTGRQTLHIAPLDGGERASKAQILEWPRSYPLGINNGFLNEVDQLQERFIPGKTEPHAAIIKVPCNRAPPKGNGNASIYFKTNTVLLNGNDAMRTWLGKQVSTWTLPA